MNSARRRADTAHVVPPRAGKRLGSASGRTTALKASQSRVRKMTWSAWILPGLSRRAARALVAVWV